MLQTCIECQKEKEFYRLLGELGEIGYICKKCYFISEVKELNKKINEDHLKLEKNLKQKNIILEQLYINESKLQNLIHELLI